MRALLVAAIATPAVVHAEPSDWHAGAEVRAELGMHPLRLTGGVGLGDVDLALTIDPLVVLDGQHDLDVAASGPIGARGWRLAGGVRATAIDLATGWHWQHHVVAAATAPLPPIAPRVRASVGVEASVRIVAHGGGVEADWLSSDEGWEAYRLGIFLRIEAGAVR